MKSLLIVCDGMGDRLTDGKTPLEAAKTPNMDKFAKKGITGIMDTVRTGIRPGSDTAHLSLFGYDPFRVYTGRGPFEAAGVGLELKRGDVALRCNFATLKNGKVIDRRAGRDEYGLKELTREVSKIKFRDTEIKFKKCAGHRAVLILRGKGLSSRVTDTDPETLNVPPARSRSIDGRPESRKTAAILNEFTRKTEEILSEHVINKRRKLPANVILCRGAGTKPELESFEERYGMNAACISATALIKGVCNSIGMKVIDVKGATGHVDSDISKKAKTAINALKKYDFVFLHIKGTDEASHDGDFNSKKEMIERIDREVIGPILEKVKDTTIVLTADHSTPISIRQHSADPVPIAILGDVRTDQVDKFTERECSKGGLNRICGIDLMHIILDLSDRAELFGA
ncbi:MAG: 2,3-bisphosphoglycerate-independent phosphoglycerate mutase [Candidatus Altiarchaeales archaeon]|nr:MAG: 2,3-bisphosphoglycerate-independent phosphoglycerate mutase [Candidatus Altiarchaeales archaeon]